MTVLTQENVRKFAGLNIDESDTLQTGLFMGMYGPGGSGKTTTMCDIVRYKPASPALLIDTEGGSSAVLHLKKFGLDVVQPTNWAQLDNILKELKRGNHLYKTVICDHITEMTQMNLLRVAPSGQPEIQEWGKILVNMMEFVREMRALTITQDLNVLLNIWEEEIYDKDTKISRYRVNLFNKWAAAFPGMVTMLGRLTAYSERPPYTRKLSFVAGEKTDSKFRVAPTDPAAKLPLEFYLRRGENVEDGPFFMVDLMKMLKEGIPFPVKLYEKPSATNAR